MTYANVVVETHGRSASSDSPAAGLKALSTPLIEDLNAALRRSKRIRPSARSC